LERETRLVVHPSRYPVSSESGREAQTRRSHGEITDKIPEQTENLDDRSDKCENGRSEL
jgi:hypothetical protein